MARRSDPWPRSPGCAIAAACFQRPSIPRGAVTSSTASGKRAYSDTALGRTTSSTAAHAPGDTVGTLWRIFRIALNYRWSLIAGWLAIILAAGFQLWIPHLLGQAVDQAEGLLAGTVEEARAALVTTALLILLASALRGTFAFFQTYLGETAGQKVAAELRMAFYEKLQRLSFSYHDKVHTGNLMSRGIVDVEGVRMFINTGILRAGYILVLIGAGAYLMFSINAQLALVSLIFVPIVGFRAIVTRLKLRRVWLDIQEKYAALNTVLQENLAGVRVVRAFAAQRYEKEKFDQPGRGLVDLTIHAIGIRVRNGAFMTFAFLVTWAAIVGYGGSLVLDGTMTVGQLTSFLLFMGVLQMPVRTLGMMVNSYARASSCGARLFEILDLEPAIANKPDARPLEVTRGVVRFENVSFQYDDSPTLENVSFEARPGHVLGVVGPPGSGKSTIAQLLPRFYDVTDGRITIDGVDIRDVTLESLRHAVALVQQDTFLFTASLHDNLAYGEPDIDHDRVEEAARIAQLHDYIETLPGGYETMVGERGVSLSGGQRQRLSIARTVLLDPKIVIFDDSTAAIDAGTERRIRQELEAATRERTTIVVSHRLSSLQHADEILVLEKGRIVERGNHEELLALGGRYRDLYELQLRPPGDTDPDKALQPVLHKEDN